MHFDIIDFVTMHSVATDLLKSEKLPQTGPTWHPKLVISRYLGLHSQHCNQKLSYLRLQNQQGNQKCSYLGLQGSRWQPKMFISRDELPVFMREVFARLSWEAGEDGWLPGSQLLVNI